MSVDPPDGSGWPISVFKTSLRGVGVAIAVSSATNGEWHGFDSLSDWGEWVQAFSGMWGDPTFGISVRFVFVKIGPIQSGFAQLDRNPVAEAAIRIGNEGSHTSSVMISWSGGAYFVDGVCETPDVSVDLGTHPVSEFGSTTGPTPTSTAFKIDLKNCPAGINSIQYRIEPVTTLVSRDQSVVALDSGSTAHGVGVQLLNDAGNPLAFDVDHRFSGYRGEAGDYAIPLRARYYKTASAVSAGSASTSIIFTMTYL